MILSTTFDCEISLPSTGALGSWGAALIEPYSDKPDTTGLLRSSPEALEAMVQKFWQDDWSTVGTVFDLFLSKLHS